MKINALYAVTMLSILATIVMSSCDKPACLNKNAIFDKFGPDAKEYKDELSRLIREKEKNDLRFWISDATLKDTHEQIVLDIQGKGVCAKMTVQNLTDKKIDRGGYMGAELIGAQFTVENKLKEVQFDLQSFITIID
jgi:hypothetical protein